MKPTPATETHPNFPSGPWEGFWIQKIAPPGKHQTELCLHFRDGQLNGEGRDWVGEYRVQGNYDVSSGRCQWTKTYIGRHDVAYEGYNEGKGIWGTWHIEMSGVRVQGGFHIWPREMPDPTGQALAEEAEAPVGAVPVGAP
jgi:hypothetical protein